MSGDRCWSKRVSGEAATIVTVLYGTGLRQMKALRLVGITKRATWHTFRHSFAARVYQDRRPEKHHHHDAATTPQPLCRFGLSRKGRLECWYEHDGLRAYAVPQKYK